MPWTPRVTVAAVIEQDGNYLLVEEWVDERLVLNQPAGHLEDGESLLDAVKREVMEETGREFQPLGLIGIYRLPMPDKDRTYLRFCFSGSASEPHPGARIDPDISGTVWLSREQLKQQGDRLRSAMVLRCIDDFQAHAPAPLELLHDVI